MGPMRTERLFLRLLEPGEAEAIETLAGEEEVSKTTLGIPHPYPPDSAAAFIQARRDAASRGVGYSFGIIELAARSFIGVIGLHVNKKHRHAELAYWIGKPYWGNGFCTEAARRVIRSSFEELNRNKVWAAAMTRNPASYKVMEKVGMKHEGTFRNHVFKENRFEDLIYYGILRSDDYGSGSG